MWFIRIVEAQHFSYFSWSAFVSVSIELMCLAKKLVLSQLAKQHSPRRVVTCQYVLWKNTV